MASGSNNFRAILPLPVQKVFGGAAFAYMSLPCVCVCVHACVCGVCVCVCVRVCVYIHLCRSGHVCTMWWHMIHSTIGNSP